MPIGMAIGAIFIAGLFNFMSFMGIPSGTGQNIMLGLVVIFFGVISKRNYKGVVK
jgi:ribose transport system permease protein